MGGAFVYKGDYAMARPLLTVTVHQIRVTLSLREGVDDDLLAVLANVPFRKRAATVKEWMRKGLAVEAQKQNPLT